MVCLGRNDNSGLGFVLEGIQDDFLKKERENFGVQQLPLFNLLAPEELDWQACLSRLEGKREIGH